MGIRCTFFLCEPSRLQAGFPSWKPPLAQPIVRHVTKPFTGTSTLVESDEPDWDEEELTGMYAPKPVVVAIIGDYEEHLESLLSPFVRSQPHWCTKNVMSVELDPLIAIVCQAEESKLKTALWRPPSLTESLEQCPVGFLERLCSADDTTLLSLAEKWAATMSTRHYTHSASGERVKDGWSTDDAFNVLRPISQLAKRRETGQMMYLLCAG